MKREDVKLGMSVTFGHSQGSPAIGIVSKLNPKRVQVKITEQYNSNPPGTTFSVPYWVLQPSEKQVELAYPVGLKVVRVSWLSARDMEREDWHDELVPVLEFEDGSIVYPSADVTGNSGGGFLFARGVAGESFYVMPTEEAHA